MIDQVAEVLGWMQQKDGSRLRDAENFIQENSNKEGFLPCLLEITGDSRYNGSDSEVNIAMGAVTILRNHIDERWDLDDISEKDRTILRDNIVPTMGQ